jgi:hypothetical protein
VRSAENPYAGQGPVLLDVGGNVGALLVMMPASMEGVEIEIRRSQPDRDSPAADLHHHHPHSHNHGDQSHLTHVEVLPRPTSGGYVHCAVFPELAAGLYQLCERPFGPVRLEVDIAGGQIAQATWPQPVGPAGPSRLAPPALGR